MSHVKTMQAFGKLKGICTGLGGAYNPGQQHLQVKALTTIQFNAQRLMDEITEARTAYDNITNKRELAFREMRKLGSQICWVLRASGAHPLTIADAVRSNRLLQGNLRYRTPLPKEEGEATDKRRFPARDFATQVENFAQLVETAVGEPLYRPREEALLPEALEARVLEMRSINESVAKAVDRFRQLRKQRIELFYTAPHSLVNTARAVRHYIRGVFGFRSTPHAELINVSLTKPTT